MPGYSGTTLQKKLGLKAPMRLVTIDAPPEYLSWLGELPEGVQAFPERAAPKQARAAHIFVTKRAALASHLAAFRERLQHDGFVWVSWPKKASKVETDITENTIREVALPLGFVDVKVCAVSDVWSGLKLVIRKKDRTA